MNEKIEKLPLVKVLISDGNTRHPKVTDPDVVSLAASIKAAGQTTPAIARPHPKKKGFFELGAGARRRMAIESLNGKTIDVIVRAMDDQELDDLILIENFQREDPTPKAEAELIKRCIDRGTTKPADIAAKMGKTEAWVVRRMRLLEVIPSIFKLWTPGQAFGHFTVEMMELVGSFPKETQSSIAEERHAISRVFNRKQLETFAEKYACRLDRAPFKLDDPKYFVKDCGPGCAHDSSKDKMLFDFQDGKKKESCGRCLNTKCFFSRVALWRGDEYKRLAGDEKLEVYMPDSWNTKVKIGDATISPNDNTYGLKQKASPGAKRVILLHKDGMQMQIAWIPKQEHHVSSGGGKKSAPVSAAVKRKEGINMHQGKRWMVVREKLVEAIEKAPVTNLTVPFDDLVAIFGLPFRVECYGGGPDRHPWWKALDNRTKGYPIYSNNSHPSRKFEILKPRTEALWPAMQVVLRGLVPEPSRVSDAPKFEEMYVRIGQLIQFDTHATKKAVDLQIPAPKSWGKVDPHTLEATKK